MAAKNTSTTKDVTQTTLPNVETPHGDPTPGSEAVSLTDVPNQPNLSIVDQAKDDVEKCWNCAEQGVKKVPTLVNGICEKCGFDLSKISNLDLLAKQLKNRSQDGKSS